MKEDEEEEDEQAPHVEEKEEENWEVDFGSHCVHGHRDEDQHLPTSEKDSPSDPLLAPYVYPSYAAILLEVVAEYQYWERVVVESPGGAVAAVGPSEQAVAEQHCFVSDDHAA